MKVLIKNGLIADGSGGKPYISDLLVEDDRISRIKQNIDIDADEIIDAKGLLVCPGFIDAHSHNDFYCDRQDSEKFFKPFIE